MMFRRQISEDITLIISMGCYFTTKSGGIWESQLGCTDLLVELRIATTRDVDVAAVWRFAEHLVIQGVSSREPVERRRDGGAEVASSLSAPPLLTELSIQVRERFSHDRMRALLAELRSQRLDEGHQNLSLDSDLFKHRMSISRSLGCRLRDSIGACGASPWRSAAVA